MNKNKIKQSSRYLALEILEKIEQEGAYSNLILRQVINNHDLKIEDRNLLTELVYGVLQRKLTLDYQLKPYIKKQKKMQSWVRQLLRLSLYQMEYLERIPPHAVVNEAVNIARVRGHKGIAGLVNAVLRNIQRKGVRQASEIQDKNKRLSIQYSVPLWLVEEFIQDLGEEEAEKLLASFGERPQLSLRLQTNKISRDDAIASLEKEGYDSIKSEISPSGIIVLNGFPDNSSLFKKGWLIVQDESSMLVAPTMNIKTHHTVLDACAAPGGKTMHIANDFLSAQAGGTVHALDIHDHKIRLLKENAEKQAVSDRVFAEKMDARKVSERFEQESFDRILVDAPCSGLGLIRRRPEIRYTKSKKDIKNLHHLQLEILDSVSPSLKTGGELVYSTCTLTKTENQAVVAQFLKKHPEFKQIPVDLPNDHLKLDKEGSITIYPHQHGTDGFFIARFKKAP